MAGIWKKYDPEVLEGYAAACRILEKGKVRVQVLGNRTIRMFCYGGTANILPPVYISDVPEDVVVAFKHTRADEELIYTTMSDKPKEMLEVATGTADEETLKEVAEDVLEEWDKGYEGPQDPQAYSKWQRAAALLKKLVDSHFPGRGER